MHRAICKLRKSFRVTALIALYLLLHASFGPVDAQQNDLLAEYDSKIKQKSTQLDSIKQELQRGKETLKKLEAKEGTQLARLERLQSTIHTTETYLSGLTAQIDSVGVMVSLLEDSLQSANGELQKRRNVMEKRLRHMYMTGPVKVPSPLRVLEILLSSKDVDHALYRVRFFQDLNRYDRALLNRIDSARTEVQSHKEAVEQRYAELRDLREEKESETNNLVAQQQKQHELIEDIRKEKEAYLAMVDELEASQKQLAQIIEMLSKQRREAKTEMERKLKIAFEKRKGSLAWPVKGDVIQEFGKIVHPVYKTVTMSNGIDILASTGMSVRSVAPGRVAYVGSMRGLGNFLMVDHAGGYLTIYANLAEIKVPKDKEVEYGTVLGTLGKSGKLHFEVRKMTDALNPRDWLE